jgi:hypothetical protein
MPLWHEQGQMYAFWRTFSCWYFIIIIPSSLSASSYYQICTLINTKAVSDLAHIQKPAVLDKTVTKINSLTNRLTTWSTVLFGHVFSWTNSNINSEVKFNVSNTMRKHRHNRSSNQVPNLHRVPIRGITAQVTSLIPLTVTHTSSGLLNTIHWQEYIQ